MAIDYQNVVIPFGGGLDSKSQDYIVEPAKVLELENLVFNKAGALSKRFGLAPLSTSIIGGGTISKIETTATFHNNLLAFDGYKAYSYSAGSSAWTDEGDLISAQTTTSQILRDNYDQDDPDVAFSNNLELYVYKDSNLGVCFSIVDHITKNYLSQKVQLAHYGDKQKVITFNNKFYIFYIETSYLYCAVVNPASPFTYTQYQISGSINSSSKTYDITVYNSYIYVAVNNTLGIYVAKLTTNGAVVTAGVIPYSGRSFDTSLSISILVDSTNIYVLYNTYGIGTCSILISKMPQSTFIESSYYTIETLTSTENCYIRRITGVIQSPLIYVYYEFQDGAQFQSLTFNILRQIRIATYNITSNVTSAPTTFKRALGLYGKAFLYANLRFIPTAYQSTLQSAYYLLDQNANIITSQSYQEGGGLRTAGSLAESPQIADGVFLNAQLRQGSFLSNGGTTFTRKGVVSTRIAFANNDSSTLIPAWNTMMTATLGNQLLITAGLLHSYDGSTICEHGFLQYPEFKTGDALIIGTSSDLIPGSYQYKFIYQWLDNFGQIHRSAPSIPIEITSSDGYDIIIQVPTLQLTNKDNVQIIGYRTQVLSNFDSTFYRFTSLSNPVFNSKSADYVVITDSNTDFSTFNDFLYTTGNVVENIYPPPCSLISTYNNRVFLAGLENSNQLYYSKTSVYGEPISFSSIFNIQLDEDGGPITGLGTMDNSLIIFKKNRLYSLSGDGPSNINEGSFFDPQSIASPVGAISAYSISETHKGLIFNSQKGIYLLDRGLAVSYIGAPVEKYKSQSITAVVDIPNLNEIRFICSDGYCLCWNYYFDQWSTFTNYQGNSAGIWNQVFYLASATTGVISQETTAYLDNTTPIQSKVATTWYSFAQLQGYQRVRDLLLLGEYKAPNTLRFDILYDFSSTIAQTSSISITSPLEQMRLFFLQPKCEALKIIITETDIGNEALLLIGLNFNVGSKKSHFKISSTKHI